MALRSYLTFANVIAMIGPFVARGGSSYAAGKITGKTIKHRSIAGKKLTKDSVTGNEIRDGSLGAGTSRAAGSLPRAPAASVAAGRVKDRSAKRVRAESAAVYGTEGHRFESCRARSVVGRDPRLERDRGGSRPTRTSRRDPSRPGPSRSAAASIAQPGP